MNITKFDCDILRVPLPVVVVNIVLSPAAVAGNSLVLAAIWRNRSLRTPSYVLLSALASTDFFTGLISQPTLAAFGLMPFPCATTPLSAVTMGFGTYFTVLTLLTMTSMSIERWLHMTRRSGETQRWFCKALIIVDVLVPVPLVVISVLSQLGRYPRRIVAIVNSAFILICVMTTSVTYFKVFRIIGHHRQQIQASGCASQNAGQPSINLIKFKKSVFTILYILLLFYITYFPLVGVMIAEFFKVLETLSNHFWSCLAVLYASSALNPLLYYWRMKDIRDGVRQILKKLACKPI